MLSITLATVYHPMFHGRKMANLERYDHYKGLTCAHNAFPLGTMLKVKYNKDSIVCEVTDRIDKGHQKRDGQWVIDLNGNAWNVLTKNAKPSVIKVKVVKEK